MLEPALNVLRMLIVRMLGYMEPILNVTPIPILAISVSAIVTVMEEMTTHKSVMEMVLEAILVSDANLLQFLLTSQMTPASSDQKDSVFLKLVKTLVIMQATMDAFKISTLD